MERSASDARSSAMVLRLWALDTLVIAPGLFWAVLINAAGTGFPDYPVRGGP